MKHELISGIEYLHEDSHRTGLLNLGGTTAVNPPTSSPMWKAAPA